ncbi:MAG: aspartate-semialdehyde dehydrogenase [Candidatus Kapaibacterium sp.]
MGFIVAVAGATGLVGRAMIKVLEDRNFPVDDLILLASKRSEGQELEFQRKKYKVRELKEDSFKDADIALFSAGGEISIGFAPLAAKSGCIVIDNSSAWRMDENVPLVVPEVNAYALKGHKGIIANPNCSTIQLVVALKPLKDRYGLKRVVCSTYQSISGAGQKGLDQLLREMKGTPPKEAPPKHMIAHNLMFHPLSDNNGFTVEEKKMYDETRRILDLPDMKIAITCVRLPFLAGHAEAVNIELESDFDIMEIRPLLEKSDGIVIADDMENDEYPTPRSVAGTDHVYIGRIHRDWSVPHGLYLWVVADNLRKGAATNAVQIAEKLIGSGLLEYNAGDF